MRSLSPAAMNHAVWHLFGMGLNRESFILLKHHTRKLAEESINENEQTKAKIEWLRGSIDQISDDDWDLISEWMDDDETE